VSTLSFFCFYARERGRELQRLIDKGVDPREVDAKQKTALAMRDLFEGMDV
jgi:hypothetical protein